MNGHKFVQRQFYQIILCAFCNEFLLNAVGYQCEDCRYTCHKKCYEKVVTKCISKSNTGVSLRLVSAQGGTHRCCCRRTMRRKSITVFLIALNQSRILEQIGVVTAVICFLSVGRTLVDAQNATSPVMQTVHTLFLISVVCRWRPQINSFVIGAISIRLEEAKRWLSRAKPLTTPNSPLALRCKFRKHRWKF